MVSYHPPAAFSGQLQRGRGSAVRLASRVPEAADAVYMCVIDDPRWDWQVDDRAGYLARMIRQLDLPLAPIERHLSVFDGEDAADIRFALAVLALLPFAGRQDAASVLRRHALEGRHWQAALEALGYAGTLGLSGFWDGLAGGIVAVHGECRIREAARDGSQPWTTWAASEPTIRRVLEDLKDEDSRPRRSPAATPGSRGEGHRGADQPD